MSDFEITHVSSRDGYYRIILFNNTEKTLRNGYVLVKIDGVPGGLGIAKLTLYDSLPPYESQGLWSLSLPSSMPHFTIEALHETSKDGDIIRKIPLGYKVDIGWIKPKLTKITG